MWMDHSLQIWPIPSPNWVQQQKRKAGRWTLELVSTITDIFMCCEWNLIYYAWFYSWYVALFNLHQQGHIFLCTMNTLSPVLLSRRSSALSEHEDMKSYMNCGLKNGDVSDHGSYEYCHYLGSSLYYPQFKCMTSYIHVHLFDTQRFTMNPQNDQLPVGLLAHLVAQHCTTGIF